MTALTVLGREVAGLRDLPAAQRRATVRAMVDDLAGVVADERVDRLSALGLVTRALRAVSPRAPRPENAEAALDALRSALDADRGPGRPPGPPLAAARTVRLFADVDQVVTDVAAQAGVSGSACVATLVEEALRARGFLVDEPVLTDDGCARCGGPVPPVAGRDVL